MLRALRAPAYYCYLRTMSSDRLFRVVVLGGIALVGAGGAVVSACSERPPREGPPPPEPRIATSQASVENAFPQPAEPSAQPSALGSASAPLANRASLVSSTSPALSAPPALSASSAPHAPARPTRTLPDTRRPPREGPPRRFPVE